MIDIPNTPPPVRCSPTYNTDQVKIVGLLRGFYDLQKLRIATGNRVCAQFKAKLGQQPSQKEEEGIVDAEDIDLLKTLRDEYAKLMDGVKQLRRATFKASPLISSYTEFILLQQYLDLENMEKHHGPQIEKLLDSFPIYTEFLSKIDGCGPLMSGVIISEIDIAKARTPSSLWQYAGLGVEADGRGTSRRAEHMHEVAYTDKDGKDAVRKGIRFNPFLKTKLVGVLSGCMLKAGVTYSKKASLDDEGNPVTLKNGKAKMEKDVLIRDQCSPYALAYMDYKHRLATDPARAEWPKGRIHRAALRYMIKRFLVDLYKVWRALEGLPVALEYHEAKQGHVHGGSRP